MVPFNKKGYCIANITHGFQTKIKVKDNGAQKNP